MTTMTSLYLEKKNTNNWIVLIRSVESTSTVGGMDITNIVGRFNINFEQNSILPITSYTYYIVELYDPYKNLVLKAMITKALFVSTEIQMMANAAKKRKRNYKLKNFLIKHSFYQLNPPTILNNENEKILISSYFTFVDFIEIYNKIINKPLPRRIRKKINLYEN